MTDHPPAEPTPRRDVGPYASVSEARTQYAATIHGIPTPTTEHLSAASSLVLSEALLLGGSPCRSSRRGNGTRWPASWTRTRSRSSRAGSSGRI